MVTNDQSSKKLSVPNFNANIPPHLLENVSDGERWIIENLSIVGQKLGWAANALVENIDESYITRGFVRAHDRQLIDVLKRLETMETNYTRIIQELSDEDSFYNSFEKAKKRSDQNQENETNKKIFKWKHIFVGLGAIITAVAAIYGALK